MFKLNYYIQKPMAKLFIKLIQVGNKTRRYASKYMPTTKD